MNDRSLSSGSEHIEQVPPVNGESVSASAKRSAPFAAIGRQGSFLWQMDSPSGAGMNLWSGMLSPNNGYPEEHAIRAATLFEAAPDLLVACEAALMHIPEEWTAARILRKAIAKATGEQA
jgi:hypothetical protein